jgi:hypothetical protein
MNDQHACVKALAGAGRERTGVVSNTDGLALKTEAIFLITNDLPIRHVVGAPMTRKNCIS